MKCLNFKNIPEFLEIFEQIKDMWCFQEIVSSIKTPTPTPIKTPVDT